MRMLEKLSALRGFVKETRNSGKTISFVPTMGALHDGHLSLVREGLKRADICIPYIFLNPKQFAPTEDLASYPQTLDADLEKLRGVNASAVYLPRAEEIYPNGFVTSVKLGGVALPLEGEFRPHFFEGVATIVAKMLLQCLPDIALFGEKDYQQLQVIKQMVCDLDIPVEIVGIETVRDQNGLALSSRNAYLSSAQYAIASQLNRILSILAVDIRNGTPIEAAEKNAAQELLTAGFEKIDYLTVRHAQTLASPSSNDQNLRILAAAWLGKTRLIDNIPLPR